MTNHRQPGRGRGARRARKKHREAVLIGSMVQARHMAASERRETPLSHLRSLFKDRSKEAFSVLQVRPVFIGKPSEHGRMLVSQLERADKKQGRSKLARLLRRVRLENGISSANAILAMNRRERRRHLGERGWDR